MPCALIFIFTLPNLMDFFTECYVLVVQPWQNYIQHYLMLLTICLISLQQYSQFTIKCMVISGRTWVSKCFAVRSSCMTKTSNLSKAGGLGPFRFHIFFNKAFLVLGHSYFYTWGVLVQIALLDKSQLKCISHAIVTLQ